MSKSTKLCCVCGDELDSKSAGIARITAKVHERAQLVERDVYLCLRHSWAMFTFLTDQLGTELLSVVQ